MVSLTGVAQTYTSISHGNWNSNTTWSTDGGLTACGCTPSENVSSFDVVVNHNLNLTGDITISGGSTITVAAVGGLTNSGISIYVEEGQLLANGAIEVKEFVVEADGDAIMNGSFTAHDKFWVNGHTALNGPSTITNANLDSTF